MCSIIYGFTSSTKAILHFYLNLYLFSFFSLVKFNQIELIGYAAGGDSLFLVYEYAQNGALSDHLHRPGIRGLDLVSMYMSAISNISQLYNIECIWSRRKSASVLCDNFFYHGFIS